MVAPAAASPPGGAPVQTDRPKVAEHWARQAKITAGVEPAPTLKATTSGQDLVAGWEEFGNPALANLLQQNGVSPGATVAACGPIAAAGLARAFGLNVDPGKLAALGQQQGLWSGNVGMTNGDGSGIQQLLSQVGLDTQNVPGSDRDTLVRMVQSGTPVVLNFPSHYMLAQGYDPATGRFYVGATGSNALRGGSDWMTLEEMGASPGNGGALESFIAPTPKAGTPTRTVAPTESATQSQPSALATGASEAGRTSPNDPRAIGQQLAQQFGVPFPILDALVSAESGWDPNATGDQGNSIGLLQNNMAGGRGAGYSAEWLRNPENNLRLGLQEIAPIYQRVVAAHPDWGGAQIAQEVGRLAQRPAAGNEVLYARAYTGDLGQSMAGPGVSQDHYKDPAEMRDAQTYQDPAQMRDQGAIPSSASQMSGGAGDTTPQTPEMQAIRPAASLTALGATTNPEMVQPAVDPLAAVQQAADTAKGVGSAVGNSILDSVIGGAKSVVDAATAGANITNQAPLSQMAQAGFNAKGTSSAKSLKDNILAILSTPAASDLAKGSVSADSWFRKVFGRDPATPEEQADTARLFDLVLATTPMGSADMAMSAEAARAAATRGLPRVGEVAPGAARPPTAAEPLSPGRAEIPTEGSPAVSGPSDASSAAASVAPSGQPRRALDPNSWESWNTEYNAVSYRPNPETGKDYVVRAGRGKGSLEFATPDEAKAYSAQAWAKDVLTRSRAGEDIDPAIVERAKHTFATGEAPAAAESVARPATIGEHAAQTISQDDMQQIHALAAVPNGGATIDPQTMKVIPLERGQGYQVASPGYEETIPANQLTPAHIRDYLRRNWTDARQQPGFWTSPDDGLTYLDMTENRATRDAAVQAGGERMQYGVFDWQGAAAEKAGQADASGFVPTDEAWAAQAGERPDFMREAAARRAGLDNVPLAQSVRGQPDPPNRGLAMADPGYAAGTPEAAADQGMNAAGRREGTLHPEMTPQEYAALGNWNGNLIYQRTLGTIRRAVEAGLPFKDWYTDIARQFAETAGPKNANELLTLFAITAGNSPVHENVAAAYSIFRNIRRLKPNFIDWEALRNARTLDDIGGRNALLDKKTGEVLKPAIPSMDGFENLWNLVNGQDHAFVDRRTLSKALRGYADGAITTSDNAKVSSYYQNLAAALDDTYDPYSTIDVWMARLLGSDKDLTKYANDDHFYRTAHAVINRVAREMGITAREAQAAGWYTMRELWTQAEQSGGRIAGKAATQKLTENLDEAVRGIPGGRFSAAANPLDEVGRSAVVQRQKELLLKEGAANKPAPTPTVPSRTDYPGKTMPQKYPGMPARAVNPETTAEGQRLAELQAPTVRLPLTEDLLRVGGYDPSKKRFGWIPTVHHVEVHADGSATMIFPGGNDDTAVHWGGTVAQALGHDTVTVHAPDAAAETVGGFWVQGVNRVQAAALRSVVEPQGVRVLDMGSGKFRLERPSGMTNIDLGYTLRQGLEQAGIPLDRAGAYLARETEHAIGRDSEVLTRLGRVFTPRGPSGLQERALSELRAAAEDARARAAGPGAIPGSEPGAARSALDLPAPEAPPPVPSRATAQQVERNAQGQITRWVDQAGNWFKRMYHGSGGDFVSPNPDRFDPKGLVGPTYYLTDEPRVAGGVVDHAGTLLEHGYATRGYPAQTDVESLRQRIADYSWRQEAADPGSPEADMWQGLIDQNLSNLAKLKSGVGPNVRIVDVPENLNLLDMVGPVAAPLRQAAQDLAQQAGASGNVIRHALASPDLSTPRLLDAMRAAVQNDKAAVVASLQRAGYDGISYPGGRVMPIVDAAGQAIEHTAYAIFPESLPKIRNALSGRAGGQISVPYAAHLGGAAAVGLAGYESDPNAPLPERLARGAAGAVLGYGAVGAAFHAPGLVRRAIDAGATPGSADELLGRAMPVQEARVVAREAPAGVQQVERDAQGLITRWMDNSGRWYRRMYHGSPNAVDAPLDASHGDPNDWLGRAVFVTPDPEYANKYVLHGAGADPHPNIRPLDVPEDLKFFSLDRPVDSGDLSRIRQELPAPDRARFDTAIDEMQRTAPGDLTGYRVRQVLNWVAPGDASQAILERSGFGGVSIGSRGAQGQLEYALFDTSVGRMRNAITGRAGGQGLVAFGPHLLGAGAGGLTGYETSPQGASPLEVARNTAVGAGIGLALANPRMTLRATGKALDTVGSVYQTSVLSGAPTMLKNLTQNLAALAFQPVSRGLRAGAEAVVARAEHRPPERFVGEIGSDAAGAVAAFGDAASAGLRALVHGVDPTSPFSRADEVRQFWGGGKNPANWPFRALSSGDLFFGTLFGSAELRTLAFRDAMKRGLKGAAFWTHVNDYGTIPDYGHLAAAMDFARQQGMTGAAKAAYIEASSGVKSWPMIEQALEGARRGTFQSKMDKVGQALQTAQRAPGAKMFLPFIATPYNAAKFDLGRSVPGGLVNVAYRVHKGAGPETSDAIGDLLMGGAFAYLANSLYEQGALTGMAPTDPRERELWKAQNKTEYSVKVGDNWYSMAWVPGFGLTAAMVATARDAIKDYQTQKDAPAEQGMTGAVLAAAHGAAAAMKDRTFLDTFSNAYDAFTGGMTPKAFESFLERTAAGFVPRAVQNLARSTDTLERAPTTLEERVRAGIPVLREGVPAQVSAATGQDVPHEQGFLETNLSPFGRSPARQDPVAAELERLGAVFPQPPEKTAQGRALTDQERTDWLKTLAPGVQKAVSELMQDPAYQALDDAAKRARLETQMGAVADTVRAQKPQDGEPPYYDKTALPILLPEQAATYLLPDGTVDTARLKADIDAAVETIKAWDNTHVGTKPSKETYRLSFAASQESDAHATWRQQQTRDKNAKTAADKVTQKDAQDRAKRALATPTAVGATP